MALDIKGISTLPEENMSNRYCKSNIDEEMLLS